MKKKTLEMAQLAILSAIIVIMAFTPLGYLRIGFLSITFITIPVCIGAITIGPWGGAILGAVFGLTSFLQCFGFEPLGTLLVSINPFTMFIACLVPRILVGLFTGLVYKALKNIKFKAVSPIVACLTGCVTNTVLFISLLWIFFSSNSSVTSFIGATTSIVSFFTILAGVNALVEIPVCTLIGAPVAKAVEKAVKRSAKKNDSRNRRRQFKHCPRLS